MTGAMPRPGTKHGAPPAKLRDCDDRTCRFVIEPKSGECQDNVPCWCAAQGLAAEDPEACRITTRLNLVILSFAAIPGIGVWQLESRGRTTFADLKGLRELFQRLDLPGTMGTPVTLRVDIVRGRNPRTGEPWEFPVFRFQSQLSLTETVARARAFAAAVDPALPPAPGRLGSSTGRRAQPGGAGSLQHRASRRSTHNVRNGEKGDQISGGSDSNRIRHASGAAARVRQRWCAAS